MESVTARIWGGQGAGRGENVHQETKWGQKDKGAAGRRGGHYPAVEAHDGRFAVLARHKSHESGAPKAARGIWKAGGGNAASDITRAAATHAAGSRGNGTIYMSQHMCAGAREGSKGPRHGGQHAHSPRNTLQFTISPKGAAMPPSSASPNVFGRPLTKTLRESAILDCGRLKLTLRRFPVGGAGQAR